MKHLILASATLLLALSASPQAPSPEDEFSETLDVNLVLLDAIVTNRDGEQILGLGPDDFIVEEEGVRQKIESVNYYTNRRLATAPEKKAGFDVEQIRESRYFVFFFDKFSGPAPIEGFDRELWRSIRAAKEFVKTDLLPEDYVAVLGHDARLEIYTDFTRDRERILEALDDARRFGNGNFDQADGPSIVEGLDREAVIGSSGWIWDGLTMTGEALSSIRGRKVMFLFSPGIPSRAEGAQILESQYYDPMVQALNASNTTVYGLNLLQIGQEVPADMNLSRLVADTGGQYFRRPANYETPLQRVEDVNNGYYLITYRTERSAAGKGYQNVDVSLRNPEFDVTARQGYRY